MIKVHFWILFLQLIIVIAFLAILLALLSSIVYEKKDYESNRIESNRIESNRISNRIESNRIESNRIESNRIIEYERNK
jgi:hypothetical protein